MIFSPGFLGAVPLSSLERFLQLLSLEHPFAMWSVAASMIIGIVCGLVGTFLVLRGMSLIGDAVGHSTLPGVAAGFLLLGSQTPWAMLLCATITGVVAAWAVSAFDDGPRTRADAAIAIVIAGGFGIGAILFTIAQASPTGAQAGLNTVFFGNVAAISPNDVWMILFVSILLTLVLIFFWRPISLSIFDRVFAQSIGVPVARIDSLLLVMLAVCVVVAIQAVGVVLVASMLIIPPTTARLLTHSLPKMALLSATGGGICGILGAIVSYLYEGVSTGPAMVLFAFAGFILAVIFRAVFAPTPSYIPLTREETLANPIVMPHSQPVDGETT